MQREEERRKKEEERRRREEERREKREAERRLKEEERNKKEEQRKKKEDEKRQIELEKERAREDKVGIECAHFHLCLHFDNIISLKERREKLAKDRFFGYFSKLDGTQKKVRVCKMSFHCCATKSSFVSRQETPVVQDPSITSPSAKSPHASFSASKKADFDSSLHSQSLQSSYLQQAKGRKLRAPAKKTEPVVSPDVDMDDEVVIVSSPQTAGCRVNGNLKASGRSGLRFKLLQFQENYRPAYYGTWQKKSSIISRRNPFRRDMVGFAPHWH